MLPLLYHAPSSPQLNTASLVIFQLTVSWEPEFHGFGSKFLKYRYIIFYYF